MLSTTIILTNLLVLVMGQSLCTQQQGTPLCASQFNGNYINCYCVVDPVTNTATRRVTLDQTSDDLNLCQNSNQNTFCCPNNFLNRDITIIFNGYIYDKWCNNNGPAPVDITSVKLTSFVDAFVTLYVTPSPTTTIVPTTVTPTFTTTVTSTEIVPSLVTSYITSYIQTPILTTITVTTLVPTLIPTTVTEYVPTPVPTTVTSYVSDYPNMANNNLQVAPLPVQTVIVTKTIVKPRYITKTRIVKITNCN